VTEYSDQVFEETEFSDAQLANSTFEDCTFKRCRFAERKLVNIRFLDCKFENCDFSLSKVLGTTFRDTIFKDCKAIGVNFTQSSGIHSVQFIDCKLSDTSWQRMDLRYTNFDGSNLANADFENARLDKASFRNARLAGTRFVKTSLIEADLSSASEYLFDPRANQLKNTKVSVPEAIVLLEVLGLKII